MNNMLVPITKKPKFKPFGILDIEAQNWIEYVVGAVFDGERFEAFGYDEGGAEELLDYIFDEIDIKILFCHFGGKYDLLFIFDAIVKTKRKFDFEKLIKQGSRILTMTITRKGTDKKLIFWDSSALLSFALETLCKAFDVPNKKGKVDYNFVKHAYDNISYEQELLNDKTIVTYKGKQVKKYQVFYDGKEISRLPRKYDVSKITYHVMDENIDDKDPLVLHHIYKRYELIDYLKNDCIGLYQVLDKFYHWDLIRKSGQAFTMASQAQKVYRTFITKPIYGLPEKIDEFVRKSYQGGRVEIFRPVFLQKKKEEIFCYDVNSLFPFVMKNFPYPLYFEASTIRYMPEKMGFYDITVEVPKMHVPPLGLNHDGKFVFPVGVFRGVWTTHEINCALRVGAKIKKVHKGMIFRNAGYIFKEFVDLIYKIRIESPKDSVHNMIAKLILNASYGKWGINNDKEDVGWEEGLEGEKPFAEVNIDDKIYRLCSRPVELMGFSNVAVASYVTSYSRVWMYENYWYPLGKDLFYCDTDSLYTTKELKSSDTELGMIKKEKDKETGEYGSPYACFLLPKTYITKHTIKMKGVPRKCMKFTFMDFYDALQGEKGRLKASIPARGIYTFSEALRRKKTILCAKEDMEKVINAEYDKRKIIKIGKPENWTTEPLTIDIRS